MLNINQALQSQNIPMDRTLTMGLAQPDYQLQTFPVNDILTNLSGTILPTQQTATHPCDAVVQLLQTVMVALQNIIALISGTCGSPAINNQPVTYYTGTDLVQAEQPQATAEKEPNFFQKIGGWLEKAAKVGKSVGDVWETGKESWSVVKDYASNLWEKGKDFWSNIKEGASSIWSGIKGWFSNLF